MSLDFPAASQGGAIALPAGVGAGAPPPAGPRSLAQRAIGYFSPSRLRCRITRARAKRRIAKSQLFDAQWYVDTYPETAEAGALNHYLDHGFAEGRSPNPLFDALWYLQNHDDIRINGVNPLLHYIGSGEREGRRPNPLFDPLWYLAHYEDVANSPLQPLRHYLTYGASEARATSEEFDGSAYLAVNPDLGGVADPLAHYLHYGRAERRAAGPSALTHGLFYSPPDAAEDRGRYQFSLQSEGYCYRPPRRPADLAARVAAVDPQVRFSIVTPVYNVDPIYLDKLVQSVEAQWYDRWELILVDDASPREDTRRYLSNLRDTSLPDPRIRATLRAKNGGIAEATNSALEIASGDYVVFLDHDDELTPDCLFALAERIAASDADFLYSDEDKIDEAGAFFMPFFKPDWSPDAFMSTMYTCHVSCVRRVLLEQVGRVRAGFDGAQDYDLILRVTEQANRIEHIPRVLYHWRTLPTSTAADIHAKPAAITAAARAKSDALKRRGLKAEVETVQGMPGQFRVNYLPHPRNKVSIIIPTKDNLSILRTCIDSIRGRTEFANYEIIVMDNGSTSPEVIAYLGALARTDGVMVLSDDSPFNFSALNNRAAQSASGDYLLFLNDDTEVLSPDWLGRMLGYAQLDHVGAVGAKLLYPDGSVQHCGIVNSGEGPNHSFLRSDSELDRYFGRNVLEFNWIAVTAACLMVSRKKFDGVGGFDEAFPIAYNDVDLCFRLFKSGFYNVVCQKAQLTHYESMSRGADIDPVRKKRLQRDWRRLYAKHPDLYMKDPFYSPNLDPYDTQFSAYAV